MCRTHSLIYYVMNKRLCTVTYVQPQSIVIYVNEKDKYEREMEDNSEQAEKRQVFDVF